MYTNKANSKQMTLIILVITMAPGKWWGTLGSK